MPRGTRILVVRLLAAVVQAALLYGLFVAAAAQPGPAWPATSPAPFVALVLVAAGVPIVVILGAGNIRPPILVGWAAAAAAVLAGLGAHAAARQGGGMEVIRANAQVWWPLVPVLLAAFFVAQVLVTDVAAARRAVPPYTRHFDTAWKQAVQVALAIAFAGVSWGVLALGAGLFQLVGVDAVSGVVQQSWFAIPASVLFFAGAVHATDVQPALLRGARFILLRLLAFLLPLLGLLVLGFLAVLAVNGPGRLWQTHAAATALLGAAAALILLVNSAYADGRTWPGPRFTRLAMLLAALELPVLLGLAGWALWLRVAEYGWSPSRIYGAALLGLLCCYALGYVASAVLRRPRVLEWTNFGAAYAGLALVLLLFTPAADPARLFVQGQVARLRAGTATPETFDFAALRQQGARWGRAALAELKADPSPAIADAARLVPDEDPGALPASQRVLTADEAARKLTVLPEGRSFPAGLLQARFGTEDNSAPDCLRTGQARCTLRFVAVTPGGPDAVLLMDGLSVEVYEQDAPDTWRWAGRLTGPTYCSDIHDALRAGRFSLVPHPARDLEVNGIRLTIAPAAERCP